MTKPSLATRGDGRSPALARKSPGERHVSFGVMSSSNLDAWGLDDRDARPRSVPAAKRVGGTLAARSQVRPTRFVGRSCGGRGTARPNRSVVQSGGGRPCRCAFGQRDYEVSVSSRNEVLEGISRDRVEPRTGARSEMRSVSGYVTKLKLIVDELGSSLDGMLKHWNPMGGNCG